MILFLAAVADASFECDCRRNGEKTLKDHLSDFMEFLSAYQPTTSRQARDGIHQICDKLR